MTFIIENTKHMNAHINRTITTPQAYYTLSVLDKCVGKKLVKNFLTW